MRALAREIVGAGLVAIVDATFPRRWQREPFRALAAELGVPFVIVAFEASDATLRERIAQRAAAASPTHPTPISRCSRTSSRRASRSRPREQAFVVAYDAEAPLEAARAPGAWEAVRRRMQSTEGSE